MDGGHASGAGVDHAEQVAVRIGKNDEVCTVGVVPLDTGGSERFQSLDFSDLTIAPMRSTGRRYADPASTDTRPWASSAKPSFALR